MRSSLKITNHSFRYAAPCLWNKLPTDLCVPRQIRSPSLSPITHGSSSSSLPSSRASSLTRSVFHSELRTWLFGKSFPVYGNGIRSIHSRPSIERPTVNGAYTIYIQQRANACPLPWRQPVYGRNSWNLMQCAIQRPTSCVSHCLRFGCMNVRSLSSLKLNALLDEFHDHTLDVTLLCEAWHDADSVAILYKTSTQRRLLSRRTCTVALVPHGVITGCQPRWRRDRCCCWRPSVSHQWRRLASHV